MSRPSSKPVRRCGAALTALFLLSCAASAPSHGTARPAPRAAPATPAPAPAPTPRAGSESGGDHAFPTPSELDALGAGPKPDQLFVTEVDEVDEWTLEGPFPDVADAAPRRSESRWESLLDEAVARRAGLAATSEAMHCAAREIGRFMLERGKLPSQSLTGFMAGRCGAVGVSVRPGFVQGEVPEGVSDDGIFDKWQESAAALVQQSLAGGPVVAGLWFGRSGRRAVVLVASTVRRAYVEPFSTVAADGRVTIAGEILGSAEAIEGAINQGSHGYAECASDPKVRLPRFRLTCALAADDPSAWLEISGRERGRVLSFGVLQALVRRPGEAADVWHRPHYAASRPVGTTDEFAKGLAESLNDVRRRVGLRPVSLSGPQSEVATALAPHVFAGSMGLGSPAAADLAALGLVAGWRIAGPIQDAWLANAFVWGARDTGHWLDAALESPSNRRSLLEPRARVLAVGSVSSEQPAALMGIAATYALFGDEDLDALADRLFERIARARADAGLSAPERLDSVTPLAKGSARELVTHGGTPTTLLSELLPHAGEAAGTSVKGWVTEATSTQEFPLPPELTQWETLRIAVAVGYHPVEGSSWGRYVAFLVVVSPDVAI